MMTVPENNQWALALAPATDAAGRTSSYFSLKDVKGKAYVRVDITQGNAATVAITLQQATTVAGGSAKALSATTRVWATEDAGTAATVGAIDGVGAVRVARLGGAERDGVIRADSGGHGHVVSPPWSRERSWWRSDAACPAGAGKDAAPPARGSGRGAPAGRWGSAASWLTPRSRRT